MEATSVALARLVALGWWGVAGLLTLGLAACGGTPAAPKPQPQLKTWDVPQNAAAPDQVKWTYQPGGLTLNLEADQKLNLYEGFSHNVLLCTYQLSVPAGFQELAANVGGIRKLLECNHFDQSVMNAERRFISPGQKSSLVMDRAEGARHVGMVAGYVNLQPGLATILHSFPVATGRANWRPWSDAVFNPETVTMNIMLGPTSIQRLGVD